MLPRNPKRNNNPKTKFRRSTSTWTIMRRERMSLVGISAITNIGEEGRYIQWESWGPRIVVRIVYTCSEFGICHILHNAALCDDTRVWSPVIFV